MTDQGDRTSGGMGESLYATLAMLEANRQETERTLGNRRIGAAACAVLDALIRRTRALTEKVPRDAPLTPGFLLTHADSLTNNLSLVARVLGEMSRLTMENENIVYGQRQPFINFIRDLESQGYTVDTVTFTTVTDGRDWSHDAADTPEVRVQLEAARITRGARAFLYQQRLQQMDAKIKLIESAYAQRIRDIIPTIPD